MRTALVPLLLVTSAVFLGCGGSNRSAGSGASIDERERMRKFVDANTYDQDDIRGSFRVGDDFVDCVDGARWTSGHNAGFVTFRLPPMPSPPSSAPPSEIAAPPPAPSGPPPPPPCCKGGPSSTPPVATCPAGTARVRRLDAGEMSRFRTLDEYLEARGVR